MPLGVLPGISYAASTCGLTVPGRRRRRSSNIAKELTFDESCLLKMCLSREQTWHNLFHSRLFSPGKVLLQNIGREPQDLVKLVVVNTEAGLEERQKSASAGEQSQANASARDKIMQYWP